MTKAPELEHREELKWVLRNIKKELLHAGPDNIVDFNASRLTNSDPDSPSLVAVYKHLKDIERATVIRMVERYDGDGFDVYAYSLDAEAGVTGYKFIVDRDKFETFYHHMVEVKIYMKDLSSDDATDFEEEKKRIGGIADEKDFNIELARWRWVKQVLDSIYVQLSPHGAHGQTVRSIDISKIPDNISRNVIDDLWDRGICGYGGPLDDHSARGAMRNGNHILVKDLDRFQKYRDGVSDFVKWIEADAVRLHVNEIKEILPTEKKNAEKVIIKNVRTGTDPQCLNVNNGQVLVPFNARNSSDDSKVFQVVKLLWEIRYEMKGNEIMTKNHETMSGANLIRSAKIKSKDALDKLIERFNTRCSERGLAIEIVGERSQYKLVIKLG